MCYSYAGRATASPPIHTEPEHEAPKIVPGAVALENVSAMMKMTAASPVGTIVYLIKEQSLLVRVDNGWQYILVILLIQFGKVLLNCFCSWEHSLV